MADLRHRIVAEPVKGAAIETFGLNHIVPHSIAGVCLLMMMSQDLFKLPAAATTCRYRVIRIETPAPNCP